VAQGPIGRVTRCSIRGFIGASRLPEGALPAFGDFCRADAAQGSIQAVGLIYDISVPDDELARQLAASENVSPEQLADHQRRRAIPVEISALTVGYFQDKLWQPGLPPQPPLTLSGMTLLTDEEVQRATEDLEFVRMVLSGEENLPMEDLLIAGLRRAARARPHAARKEFLVRAGRECARRMPQDLTRLETVLAGLRPDAGPGGIG
jgi:hypothetical protein